MPDEPDKTVTRPPADPAPAGTGLPLTTPHESAQPPAESIGSVPTQTSPHGSGQPAAPDVLPPDLADHPRYRIIRRLGQGGMGAVYLAEHRIMGRLVALKVIHPRYTASPTAVERFRREVRAAARLSHPNIVAAFDAEQAGGVNFLVMEYVEGRTLGEYVHETGPLPVREACGYILQAARAVQYAHDQGMIHRDIKPDNLMLTPAGEVRVLDFGLARLRGTADPTAGGPSPTDSALTAAGAVMGTPDYMAPEQASDAAAADARSDVYALGATLFHLLTGTVPFPGGTAAEKLRRQADEPAPPASAVRDGVPPGLEKLVGRMLAKNPAGRPPTAAEVARRLAPYGRRSRLRWWAWGAAAAVVLALVAAALVGYYVVYPGRGEIDFAKLPPGVVVEVAGQTSGGRSFQRQYVTGQVWSVSLPPGEYVVTWDEVIPDRGRNRRTERVMVKRDETSLVVGLPPGR